MARETDEHFFTFHPDRQIRIRLPEGNECQNEFRSLGDHNAARRRILVYRVPKDNPYYDPNKRPLLKIPFLLFSEESVEDTDEILLPILHEIMMDAAKNARKTRP
jgi:hypothetical protein